MAEIFNCSWDGTGTLNNPPGAGENSWNSETDTVGELNKDTSSNGYCGETNCIQIVLAGGGSNQAFLQYTNSSSGTIGARFSIDWYSEGLSSGSYDPILELLGSGTVRCEVSLFDDSGTRKIQLRVHNGFSLQTIGSVDVDSYFNTGEHLQVLVLHAAGSSSAMKIYRENGSTQVGSTISTASVSSVNITPIWLGKSVSDTKTWSAYIDIANFDDADYPSTESCGGGETVTLTGVDALAFAGNSLSINESFIFSGLDALAFTGKSMKANDITHLAKVAIAWTGNAMNINEVYVFIKGALSFVGKTLSISGVSGFLKGLFRMGRRMIMR